MKRRDFIKDSSLFLLTSASAPFILKTVARAADLAQYENKVLVVVFQRGAADGLSMVVPHGDSFYGKKIRPNTALTSKETLKLDNFFGLHPALKDLMPLWDAGNFAVIHQVGSPNATRSHFDAQDFMESGAPGVKSIDSGFLDRLISKIPDKRQKSIFKGIAMQPNLPRALWGTSGGFAMDSIQGFSQSNISKQSNIEISKGFETMYDSALDQVLRGVGQNTLEAMKTLKNLPGNSTDANYPKGKLGKHLADIARMIKGQVGLQVAITDCGGWDTHQRQGAANGQLANELSNLGSAIAAFTKDLGLMMKNVCLVTMTEFGRTVKENGNGGTDHGHGSVMFLVGEKVIGRQVRSRWTSLNPELLYEGRDLPVTTDFRDVFCEVFTSHLQVPDAKSVFPDFIPSKKMIGLFG
jgi:uncharacterized protein (DUF1501 family)